MVSAWGPGPLAPLPRAGVDSSRPGLTPPVLVTSSSLPAAQVPPWRPVPFPPAAQGGDLGDAVVAAATLIKEGLMAVADAVAELGEDHYGLHGPAARKPKPKDRDR